LLRDRARAGDDIPLLHVLQGRPHDARQIDPRIAVKRLILDGDRRPPDVFRQFLQGDVRPAAFLEDLV